MKEECGVFGVFGNQEAAKLCYLGLYALQHRGEESAGIVSASASKFYVVKGMGQVSQVFNEDNLHYLKGKMAIGHVRYSTTGSSNINNVQPLYSKTAKGKLAIAHNGNLTNAFKIFNKLKAEGSLFQSTVDSEILLHMIAKSKKNELMQALQESLKEVEGAFSLVILGPDCLIGLRDTFGFRPLVIGKLGDSYILTSETCALDLIGAKYVREVEPGEIVCIDKNGLKSYRIPKKTKIAQCVFEYIYFARPDSLVFGNNVHLMRKAFGKRLAQEYPVEADMVIAIPDSGNSPALGYAEQAGIPFEIGITRNHYIGRTFIQPEQKIRDFNVRIKLNPIREILAGKRVIVVDDSIVRGTTSRKRVKAIKDAGAKEVHLRISSPPVKCSCYFGIDTPKRKKLIAANNEMEEIRKYIGADSLGYLSIEGMLSCIKNGNPQDFCCACFDGKYPLKVKNLGKYSMEGKKIQFYAKKK